VILGTAAIPEVLEQLPKERVIAALDARDGEIVVEGWTKKTGNNIFDKMEELKPYVGGFLVTFVEREGRMQGIDLELVEKLVKAAGDCKLTVAGGVTTKEDVAAIDKLGADAQVGMALYTGKFDLADPLIATLKSDRKDGLWPTVIIDELGTALGLAYSSAESLAEAIRHQRGIYYSRSRGLWRKGESSGAVQELLRVDLDCDRDTLRFTVRQELPGFCHLDTYTCWGELHGYQNLEFTLQDRLETAPAGSYTRRLFEDPGLLASKLKEEAKELADAVTEDEVVHEAADVLYFTMVAMARAGISLVDVRQELERRALKVTRRRGDAKLKRNKHEKLPENDNL
jgi:phosphoribosyl-ATP pyrophosphohydrolase/phosphoribosyl-AMP cyclohydrolase